MQVKPLPGLGFGAEVTGIDLATATPADRTKLHAAWLKYNLLLIRGQDLRPQASQPCLGVLRVSAAALLQLFWCCSAG